MGTRHRLLWGRAGGSSTPQHTLPLLAPAPSLLKQAKDPRFLPGSWKTGVMLLGQVCKKKWLCLETAVSGRPMALPLATVPASRGMLDLLQHSGYKFNFPSHCTSTE